MRYTQLRQPPPLARPRIRGVPLLLTLFTLCALIALISALPVGASGNAGYATFDQTAQGCLDNPNGVNCNNYSEKDKGLHQRRPGQRQRAGKWYVLLRRARAWIPERWLRRRRRRQPERHDQGGHQRR